MAETTPMTIEEFCNKHNACFEGKDWAIANCKSMQDAWESTKPEWVIWIATRNGVLTKRETCLFLVDSLLAIEHLLKDDRSKAVIKGIEQFANDEITFEEMLEIKRAADGAASINYAAYAAAYAATTITTANNSANNAAYATYYAAYAVSAAASAAVYASIRQRQADWLRSNTHPNFK